jgi:hypothetical protein
MNLTFLIPVKLESEDRIRNLITVLSFLSKFNSQILVKESDISPKFENFVLPNLKNIDNIDYTFEKQNNNFFHKTKILNDLIDKSTTEVVANYDTDVILPIQSIQKAYKMIASGYSDVVYPYGCGVYQRAVTYTPDVYEKYINSSLDDQSIDILKNNSILSNSTIGWCQFIRKKNYINSYMMNEEFAAWGPEDCELYYRLNVLGNKVDRIDDIIYHLNHARSVDSWFQNPYWRKNTQLWNQIRQLNKKNMIEYYSSLDYVKRRNYASF